jgi:hypothetical protein
MGTKRLQIGVMGSTADQHYPPAFEVLAAEIGKRIAAVA